jgi:hypothetical protein
MQDGSSIEREIELHFGEFRIAKLLALNGLKAIEERARDIHTVLKLPRLLGR